MKGIFQNGNYIKHEDEANRLRMGGGSWTINLDWLTQPVERIIYITDKARYEITYVDALKYGFPRNFQGENKLVIPLKNWIITKL